MNRVTVRAHQRLPIRDRPGSLGVRLDVERTHQREGDPIPAGNTVTGNFSPQVVPGAAGEVWVTTSSDGTAYVYGTWAYTEPNP